MHLEDIRKLIRKLRGPRARQILTKLVPGVNRSKMAWSHSDSAEIGWWSLEEVSLYQNELVTGKPGLDPRVWIASLPQFSGRKLKGLSVGCGTGSAEIKWGETGIFSSLTGIDQSENRIREAIRKWSQTGKNRAVTFQTADFYKLPATLTGFDCLIFEGSLHHFYPVREALELAMNLLVPGGFLILNEYTGPNRFQWTDLQLQSVNEVLESLPASVRTFRTGGVKQQVFRPGTLTMFLSDPSEAPDSTSILSAADGLFNRILLKPAGGVILQPLLDEIAWNFSGNPDNRQILIRIIENEKEKISRGYLPSDFHWGIWQKAF